MRTPPLLLRRWSSAALLTLLAACSGEVPSPTADFANLPLWVVDSVPSATIGSPLGDDAQELNYVRAATFLPDGSVVVADQGRFELRYYSPTASFVRSFGRDGEGPGEFRALVDLTVVNDTLLAYDLELNRFTWVSRDAKLIGSVQAPLNRRVQLPIVLARGDSVWFFVGPRVPRGVGLVRDTLTLVVLNRRGGIDSLLSLPGEEHWAERGQRGGITWQTDFTHRRLLAAGRGANIYLAVTDSPVLRRHGVDGRLLKEVRWDARLIPFDRAARGEYLAYFKDYPEKAQRDIRRRLDSRREPPTLPVLSRLLVDAQGNVWVRPYTLLATTPAEWMVFDSALVPLARASMLPGVVHIDAGRVLVRWQDADDVNYVRLHPIRTYPHQAKTN